MTELDIILKLQALSNSVLDYIMYFLTQMGDEIFFLGIAVVFFWCVDKKIGYKFIVVFMFGQLFSGIFKTVFKRPRPYQEGARAIIHKSSGYSFSSGHSQNIANISTQIALFAHQKHPKRFKLALILGLSATAIVMFTRLYLGQHYPTDVFAGAFLGIIVAIIFSKLFELFLNNEHKLVYVFLPISLFLLSGIFGFNANVAKVAGSLGAISLGYYLEKRFVDYKSRSRFLFNVLKVVVGIAVLVAIKEGVKLMGARLDLNGYALYILDYFRYFLVGIVATLLAPITFKALKI